MRKIRKKEHIENYLRTVYEGDTLFKDIFLQHNALPDLNFEDIDTRINLFGKMVDYPIIVNAMTGGSDFAKDINKDLARLAKEFNIPMAVGSQTIALSKDEEAMESFKVVREEYGDGVIIANLSGDASIDDVRLAVDLVDADAIQLHLNPAQEIVMEEGDRKFKGILDNIARICKEIDKPVIVKEVGLGISKEVAEKLYDVGIRWIDVSGSGGTNFIEIENMRYTEMDYTELYEWGIPTALALLECRQLPRDLNLISSGGIRSSLDIAKSMALGSKAVGIAGEILLFLLHGGYDSAKKYLENTTYKFKVVMLLLGKSNVADLAQVDYRIKGELRDLLKN